MLVELSITDFAIIDELRIPFEPGLNALTGETGAGKSIIIDALGAVLGERVGADVVRSGAKGARIEATFDVGALAMRLDFGGICAELGIEPEEEILILNREVAVSGRSTARINGRATTASALARVGALLVDIHGQSDHLSLLRPSEHLDILDRYAGLGDERAAFAAIVRELHGVRDRIARVEGSARERAQRADLLAFQVNEIIEANPRVDEEEELLLERTVLANAERLATDAARAYKLLAEDDEAMGIAVAVAALSGLRQVSGDVAGIAAVDESMTDFASRFAEQVYLLEDFAHELRAYRDRIEADPARLEAVEERLDLLKTLKRKYGASIEEVIAYGERAGVELESLTGGESNVETLREREAELIDVAAEWAHQLSEARRDAAARLANETERSITELNMGRARFEVAITDAEDARGLPVRDGNGRRVAFDEHGIDRVEFLLAPNAGEFLKPLARVASGGEMARLMLALKSILSVGDATPTLVFDEVDVGVGGRSGQVVGEKLWSLTGGHQVIVITHLAQIAAFASTHFRITKGERDGRVTTNVDVVSERARVDEIAAMLDGLPVTAAAQANAEALIERVATWIDGRHVEEAGKRRVAAGR
ncbi:MAG: DNA repair protein RecN [Thermomicrobiales bacterium]